MTDHPVSPEPRTEAGRRLAALEPHRRLMVIDAESEARTAALREVADRETAAEREQDAIDFIDWCRDLAAIASLRGEK